MKYVKLFEEFNPYSGKQFADKLKIYAEAAECVKSVSPYTIENNLIVFDVYTNIPGDYKLGNKVFKVCIPTNIVSKAYVETYESGQKVFTTGLEPDHENDINDILYNYIEALELYDDTTIENLVDAYQSIKTVKDIQNIVKQLG